MAAIIREVMTEHGACGPGFAIHDPEVDTMAETYRRPRAAYFVVEDGERLLGGGGIAPLDGGDDDVCELRKMYFLPAARGRGAGTAMLERCLEAAKAAGFRLCYLETLASMGAARKLYEKYEFRRIGKPLGRTGHFGCDSWYVREV